MRIGALKHLANFLSLLSEETRNAYLPRLEEFLKMDNERNWRFRLELTEQLGHLVSLSLFSASDIREYLAPMATQLVQDKVSSVRVAATTVLSHMLSKLHSLEHPILASSLANSLVTVLGKSPHWAKRQTYAVLCGELLRAGDTEARTSYSHANFNSELLPHLLDLAWDKVKSPQSASLGLLGGTNTENGGTLGNITFTFWEFMKHMDFHYFRLFQCKSTKNYHFRINWLARTDP